MDKLDSIIEQAKNKIKSAKVDTKIQCYTTMIIEMPGGVLNVLIIVTLDNVKYFKLDFNDNNKEREILNEEFIRESLGKYHFIGPMFSLIGDKDVEYDSIYKNAIEIINNLNKIKL